MRLLPVLTVSALVGCGKTLTCRLDAPTSACEGLSCTANAQCAKGLVCFPMSPNGPLGQCRWSCSPTSSTCGAASNCYDPGAGLSPACVPAPPNAEPFSLTVQSVTVPATKANGGFWDGSSSADVPDPFVCFAMGTSTLCTNEQHGYSASWKTAPFATALTPDVLFNTSITVFDSDAIFDFSTCEGECPELAIWSKEVVYGKAFDLRPLWSHQAQVFTLTEGNGFRLELHLDPQ